ncbi:AAA family ATPase [Candidatus Peregrinibacteria bacterium]|nr:AAA family ATPase [Candidatus Peregrinibacteria bacterium]
MSFDDTTRETSVPDNAAIMTIAALTRDLAALQYERAQAERAGESLEAASITAAIIQTKEEIATLTEDPAKKKQFEAYREEQFALVERVHDLQRKADHIEELRHQEHRLSRPFSSRVPSSHAKKRHLSFLREQSRLQEEIDQALREDATLALAWRSWQLREYRRQFRKDRFVETPSRTVLLDRLSALLADERKVLLTGPTGTGKTELSKHAMRAFSGEPEVLSGHQGLTSYDVYGKPILTTSPDGATISSFHLGAFPRAASNGRGLIIDEIDLIPTQTLLRHKADWNLRSGGTLKIQEDASTTLPIQKGFGVIATANIKGAKHKERESLDPAVTRLFEPLPVSIVEVSSPSRRPMQQRHSNISSMLHATSRMPTLAAVPRSTRRVAAPQIKLPPSRKPSSIPAVSLPFSKGGREPPSKGVPSTPSSTRNSPTSSITKIILPRTASPSSIS